MAHHFHNHHAHLHEARDDGVSTAVQVVYVTASPTFDGPIASYSTPALESHAPTSVSSMPAVIAAPSNSVDTNAMPSGGIVTGATGSSLMPTPPASTASTQSAPVLASAVTAGPSGTPTAVAPSATPTETNKGGMSTGAQAGLAIGLLALAVIIITAGFFFYRAHKAKKNAQSQKIDDEKSPFGGNQPAAPAAAFQPASATAVSPAPRLSLGNPLGEKGLMASPAPARALDEKSNPFGDHNKLPEAKLPSLDSALAPKPLNVSRPGTPTKEDVAAGAAPARPASPTQQANVHRVQLDFNPSMDDELELRQGQLVRMLHEYDDGWCLCIRLDRSQQGVVPRSCVSKAPVKPRANGPPPAGRPAPQQGKDGRARSNSSQPRPSVDGPFGDGQYRARSSTVDSKPASIISQDRLSNSPNNNSPEATSPTLPHSTPARKPVPGQAV